MAADHTEMQFRPLPPPLGPDRTVGKAQYLVKEGGGSCRYFRRGLESPLIPKLDRRQPLHFIGAGGIGMSALAGILAERGFAVSGSDPRPDRCSNACGPPACGSSTSRRPPPSPRCSRAGGGGSRCRRSPPGGDQLGGARHQPRTGRGPAARPGGPAPLGRAGGPDQWPALDRRGGQPRQDHHQHPDRHAADGRRGGSHRRDRRHRAGLRQQRPSGAGAAAGGGSR